MNFQNLHKQRKAILIAAAIGAIAMFLPWVDFLGLVSVNGLHGIGVLVLLAFIGAGLVAFLQGSAAPLDKTRWAIAMACGGLAAVILLYRMLSASEVIGLLGIGFWLALLASIGLVAVTWMFRDPSYTLQGGFDTLKEEVSRRAGNKNAPPPASPPTHTVVEDQSRTELPPVADRGDLNGPPPPVV